jgi:endonuclease/exonuclease/phosphatase family metal-dependent hydrolase
MIDRWEARLYRLHKWFSRSEWMARLLGLPHSDQTGNQPGLVLLQIDGFSRVQLERALRRGRMPFVRRLLDRERYRLHTMYSGLPSTTPAVQAELFYGIKTAVAAFGFRSHTSGEIVQMLDPEIVAEKEAEIAACSGEPLLAGGSAYVDNLTGGAAEPHFSIAALTCRELVGRLRPWLWPIVFVLYLPTMLRIACRMVIELLDATQDAARGMLRGQGPWDELKFIPRRILTHVILREWSTIGAQIDAARGLRVIHVNFVGYDEMAHRRGPQSAFAHWSLRGIDRCLRRIWHAAAESSRREYDTWIYADHGQESVTSYIEKHARSIQDAVIAVFADENSSLRIPNSALPTQVAAMGPVGYVYPHAELTDAECERLAERLVREASVPAVLYSTDSGSLRFLTRSGRRGTFPDQATDLLGEDHPFLGDIRTDLVAMCRHPEAGRIVLCGFSPDEPLESFPPEHGAHAGPGPEETGAFAVLPIDAHVPASSPYLRPLQLREAALEHLGRGFRLATGGDRPCRGEALRVVTLNVHSCIGMDGRVSPRRVARVLAQCDPDIVALQELDVRRRRSVLRDQVDEIARHLNMTFHFHPAMTFQDEQYGDAILSHLPMRLVRAAALPTITHALGLEPRGALWVEVTAGAMKIQVFNTHLSLNARERLPQVEALLGPDWLGHPQCTSDHACVIFCSDLNSMPRSPVYLRISQQFRDAQLSKSGSGRAHGTFFSRWPLVRIDHVFVRGPLQVVGAEVVRSSLARQASDHLPLVVELRGQPQRSQAAHLETKSVCQEAIAEHREGHQGTLGG